MLFCLIIVMLIKPPSTKKC